MFHHSYPSAFASYRSPISQPTQVNPRDKYLAALAEAKAAEAEYLAAERLQQEEDGLRQRLEQIQRLKHQPTSAPSAYYTHTPAATLDLDALRRQIAAEERARIIREQELEAVRAQEVQRKQARELEAQRIHEARKSQQAARDAERSRALTAQRARLEALTQRALAPVRVFVSEDTPRRHHEETKTTAIDLEDLFRQLFGGGVEEKQTPKPKKGPDTPQVVNLEQFIQHVFGASATPQHKAETEIPKDAQGSVTLEQLISHFLGAAGVEQPKATTSVAPSASTSAATQPKAESSEKKQTLTPAPTQSAPAPAPKSAPAASSQAPQSVGIEHFLNQFLGAHPATPNHGQADLQQLLNMFLGGASPAPAQPQAGSSTSASTSTSTSTTSDVKKTKTELEEREERELAEAIRLSLAEAIRLSLAEAESQPTESKGKAPAPAPVTDVASSSAEVAAIDASFTALANEFVFPPQLDFSTSRESSPTRDSAAEESVIARLSYSPQSQPVRFYHQALTGLLARLDAVESFGDEGVRHERKEVVGRVEGALDEVEKVVEARWRKWVGRGRSASPAPVSAESPVPTVAEEEKTDAVEEKEEVEVPVAVDAPAAEETVPAVAEDVAAESIFPESTTFPEPASSPEETPSSSYPPASMPSESVATPHPVPSDVDAAPSSADEPEPAVQKRPRASDSEDAGSDWSEVDA
ncbi:BAG domain-containing protein [Mycena venus]|uniref:BAG domain-containing protein n=1 Tax=Mycena venus TaxID=2733690 RepID=A0A8H6YKQ8_9AGAR|nr:BAG domain-containing protein [Mycena venus]